MQDIRGIPDEAGSRTGGAVWNDLNTRAKDIHAYYVIEINDNEIKGITECRSMAEAMECANNKLKNTLESIGMPRAYENSEGEDDIFCRCRKGTGNAWIRYKDTRWDAYVYSNLGMSGLIKKNDAIPKGDMDHG